MPGYRGLVSRHFRKRRQEVQLDVKVRNIFDELRERDVELQQEVQEKDWEVQRLNEQLKASEKKCQEESAIAAEAKVECQKTLEQVLTNVSKAQHSAQLDMNQRVDKVMDKMIASMQGGNQSKFRKMFNPKKLLKSVRASMDASAHQGAGSLGLVLKAKGKDQAKQDEDDTEEDEAQSKRGEAAKARAGAASDIASLRKSLSEAEAQCSQDRSQAKEWHNKYCAVAEYGKELKAQQEQLKSELQQAESRAEEMQNAQKVTEAVLADSAGDQRQAHQARLMEALQGNLKLQAANEKNRKLAEEKGQAETQVEEMKALVQSQAAELRKQQQRTEVAIEKEKLATEEFQEMQREAEESQQQIKGAKSDVFQVKMGQMAKKMKRNSAIENRLRKQAEAENEALKLAQEEAEVAQQMAARLASQQALKIIQLQNELEAMTEKYSIEYAYRKDASVIIQQQQERLAAEEQALAREGNLKAQAVQIAKALKEENINLSGNLETEHRSRKAWQQKAFELEKEVEELKETISQVQSENGKLQQDLESTETELKQWKKAKEGEELMVMRTQKELTAKNQDLKKAKVAHGFHMQLKSVDKGKIASLEGEVATMQLTIQDYERQVAAYEELREKLESDLQEVERTLEEERRQKAEEHQHALAAGGEVAALREEVSTMGKTYSELEEKHNKMLEELEKVKAHDKMEHQQNVKAKFLANALRMKNTHLKKSIKNTEKLKEELEQKLAEGAQTIQREEEEIHELQRKLHEEEEREALLEQALLEYKGALATEEKKREGVEGDLNRMVKTMSMAQDEAKRRANAESQVAEKEKQLQETKRLLDENMNKVMRQSVNIGNLEAELTSTNAKYEKVVRKSVHQGTIIEQLNQKDAERAKELQDTEAGLQEVLQAAERYKSEHGSLSKESQKQIDIIQSQRKQVKRLEEELHLVGEQLVQCDKKLDKEKHKTEALLRQAQVSKWQAAAKKKAAEENRGPVEEQLEELQLTNKNLHERIERLEEDLKHEKIEKKSLQEEIKLLKKAKKAMAAESKRRTKSMKDLANETAGELREDLTKEMERANVLEQDNNFLSAELDQYEDRVTRLSAETEEQHGKIDKLEDYIDQLEASVQKAERAQKKARMTIQKKEAKLQEEESELAHLKTELKKFEGTTQTMHKVKSEIITEKFQHAAEVAKLSARAANLQKAVGGLESQKEESQKRLAEALRKIESLTQEVNAEKKALEERENQLVAAENAAEKLSKKAKKNLDKSQEQVDDMKRQLQEWKSRALELEEKLQFADKVQSRTEKAKRQAQERLYMARETIMLAENASEEQKREHEELLQLYSSMQHEQSGKADVDAATSARLQQFKDKMVAKVEEEHQQRLAAEEHAQHVELQLKQAGKDLQDAHQKATLLEATIEKMRSDARQREIEFDERLERAKALHLQDLQEAAEREQHLQEALEEERRRITELEMSTSAALERCRIEEEKRIIAENWRDADQNFDVMKLEREVRRLKRIRLEEHTKFQNEKLKLLEEERKEIQRITRRESMSIIQGLQQELFATKKRLEELVRRLEEHVKDGRPITKEVLRRILSEP